MRHMIWILLMWTGPVWGANECGENNIVENRKDPIPFQKFEMVNPETGERYHPNDLIETTMEDGSRKKVRAADYFAKLNATEQMLNEWGYSLRNEEPSNLTRLNYCQQQMEKQRRLIDKAVREGQAEYLETEEEWLSKWSEAFEEYQRNIPSWEELYRLADDETYDVYMPEVPVYQPPRPKFEPTKVEFSKEKSYELYKGSNDTFAVGIYPYYKLGATKVEANGEAGLKVTGALVGKWEGEVARIAITGRSPGSGALTLNLVASVVDGKKTWNKSLIEEGALRYHDNVRASEAYEVKYRFAIGPIPMAATVGLRAEAGFQWGFELYALQMGGYCGPFAAADAYLLVGADVVIGGVGVGGRLRIAEYDLNLQGSVLFDWQEEPVITLSLALVSNLNLLAGDIYAYAYIYYPVPWPPWKKRAEYRHTFFDWEGFRKSGTLFDYRARYSRDGLIAEGDLSAEDILEMNHTNRVRYVEELERMAQQSLETLQNISIELGKNQHRQLPGVKARLASIQGQHERVVDDYWQTLREWL